MMKYLAKISKQSTGGFLVEFQDLPGCLTEGNQLKDALKNAKEALDGWLAASCDRNLNIPPAKHRKGRNYHPITVSLHVEFSIRLRQLRKKRGLTQQQVADRLEISQQAYAKLETPEKSNPSLTTLQKLSDALDAEIDIHLAA